MQTTLLRRAFFAALVFPATLVAQTPFEGAVTITFPSQRSQEITYLLKGDKVRLDMSGPGGLSGYLIHDGATDATSMVMPAQRMYVDFKGMQGMAQAAPQAAKKPEIKMTGKKETIAGYECEHMIATSDEGQFDVCAAKGFGSFMTGSGPMGSRGSAGGPPSSLELLGSGYFPLKAQKVDGEVVLLVTKIEKKSLDPSLFTVPADFTKMQLPMRGRP